MSKTSLWCSVGLRYGECEGYNIYHSEHPPVLYFLVFSLKCAGQEGGLQDQGRDFTRQLSRRVSGCFAGGLLLAETLVSAAHTGQNTAIFGGGEEFPGPVLPFSCSNTQLIPLRRLVIRPPVFERLLETRETATLRKQKTFPNMLIVSILSTRVLNIYILYNMLYKRHLHS